MKIKSVRIENFRSFQDELIFLNRYTCFVGPNGAGKSTVLSALNIFFQERTAATDVTKLDIEDFCRGETDRPIRVTVTFDDLSREASDELAAYARNGELIVTAEATFIPEKGFAEVRHFGQRLGIPQFRPFFEEEKAGARAGDLAAIYDGLRRTFPDLGNPRAKDDKIAELRRFEAANPHLCELIPSEDDFYGINSTGKLSRFVQWVYVPAVKDAREEGQEGRNTALARLIARAVRARTNLEGELEALKNETRRRYQELLARNEAGLRDIAERLQRRLEAWAHPNVRLGIKWLSDPERSISFQQPTAGIKTGEGDFLASLTRMGHGLQRSYLLALLQELASSEVPDAPAPTLILACEEPELYQHPPQARHLADLFEQLSQGNNQILVTTHSPLFVSGEGFENTRLVRKGTNDGPASVKGVSFVSLCARIRHALGEDPQRRIEGLIAKVHQALQPHIAEMFFARVPVLVEGLEDISYITTELHLAGTWTEFGVWVVTLSRLMGRTNLSSRLRLLSSWDYPSL